MAKIIFQNKTQLGNSESNSGYFTKLSDRDILKKRSEKYLNMIKTLDTDLLSETKGKEEMMTKIHEEFGTANLMDLPIGILAKCFLGHPHEVHTLDLTAEQIIKHYTIGEPLPDYFEKARSLAKHNAYFFVEVYKDKLILIREDGTAAKL